MSSELRCDWWYFRELRKWDHCVCLCVHVCSRGTLLWSLNIPKWHCSHNFAQKAKRHILSALLRTTLRSLMNGCRRVNVELKTIKINFKGQRNLWGNRSSFFQPQSYRRKCLGHVKVYLLYDFALYTLIWGAPDNSNNKWRGWTNLFIYHLWKDPI